MQENRVLTGGSRYRGLLVGFPFALLLIGAGFIRFYKLTSVGLYHGDALIYMLEAFRWSNAIFVNYWAKPGYHLLGAIAVKVLGMHDYATPALNGFCDLVTILLIMVTAKQIRMGNSTAFSAALAYAFMPSMILHGRIGMSQVAAATFLLISFSAFIHYVENDRRISYLVYSGLAITYAGTVHPSLLSLPGFYGLAILALNFRPLLRREKIVTVLAHEVIFALACSAVYLGFALIFQASSENQSLTEAFWKNIVQVLFTHRDQGILGASSSVLGKFAYSLVVIPTRLSTYATFLVMCISLGLFMASLAASILGRSKETSGQLPKEERYLLLIWSFVFYNLTANAIFARGVVYTNTIQMVPFILLGTFSSIEVFLKRWKARHVPAIVLGISISLTGIDLGMNSSFFYEITTPTIYRQVSDILSDKLDIQNQLLIAPSSFDQSHDGFKYYLPGYYHYIPVDWDPGLFWSKMKELNIRFVAIGEPYFTTSIHHRYFSKEEEYRQIHQLLDEMHANLIYKSAEVSIYKIPPKDSQ